MGFVETEAANEEEEEDDESLINDATAELKNNLVNSLFHFCNSIPNVPFIKRSSLV